MPTSFKIQIPVANVFKFTREGQDTSERASFDQRRYADSKHAGMDERSYFELREKADGFKIQSYTNYPATWIELLNCDYEVLDTIQGVKIHQFRDKHYYSSALFSTIEGKMFVFFRNETEYSDSAWATPIASNGFAGKLPPINAEVGDQVRFQYASTDHVTEILEKRWSPELSAEGYLLDFDITVAEPELVYVDINYDERPVDLYEIVGSLAAVEGLVFARMRYGMVYSPTVFSVSFLSEPISVETKHPETKALYFRQNGDYEEADKWNFEYAPNDYSLLRIPANMYQVITAGELEVDVNDSGVQRKSRAEPFRQIQFNILDIPGYIMDKLMVIFSHDTLRIDGYLWEIDNYGQYEGIQLVDLGTLQINLRQKNDRSLFENDVVEELTASFDPDNAVQEYTAGSKFFDFNTNTGQQFSFINLPAWITVVGGNSFGHGSTIELAIEENPAAIGRGVILIAQSTAFGNDVQATIDLDQEFDEAQPEFLTANANSVVLTGESGSESPPIAVSASGPYSVSQLGSFTTWIVNGAGTAEITVEAPSANNTTAYRTGTIRLTLDSNPSIFFDIAVTQESSLLLFDVFPLAIFPPALLPPGGQVYNFGVDVAPGAQWQVSSPQSTGSGNLDDWIHFDPTIKTGDNGAFPVTIDAKPPYVPNRVGSIVFRSVLQPSNQITVTVTQNS